MEEVNLFLRSHRILSVDRHFVQDGANSVWAICVSYLGEAGRPQAIGAKRPKVDYREVLSEPDFAVFAKLRNAKGSGGTRRRASLRLFTNEQLAEMVRRRVTTASALREIDGVGEARAEKYGSAFLALLKQESAEKLNGSVGGADAAQQR